MPQHLHLRLCACACVCVCGLGLSPSSRRTPPPYPSRRAPCTAPLSRSAPLAPLAPFIASTVRFNIALTLTRPPSPPCRCRPRPSPLALGPSPFLWGSAPSRCTQTGITLPPLFPRECPYGRASGAQWPRVNPSGVFAREFLPPAATVTGVWAVLPVLCGFNFADGRSPPALPPRANPSPIPTPGAA